MLKRHAAFFSLLRLIIDAVIINCAWVIVYYLRFYSGLFTAEKGIPDFKKHMVLLLPVICLCCLSCFMTGLYKPKRVQSAFNQLVDILRATMLSGLFVLAFLYYLQSEPYSRKLLLLFIVILFAGLVLSHLCSIALMRTLRKKGYNLRHYAVIGAGKQGQLLVREIEQTDWFGLKCQFFVDNNPGRVGGEFMDIPIYGPVEKLIELVDANPVDEVYLAPGGAEAQAAYPLLERLQLAGTTVRIMPDWGDLTSIGDIKVVTIGSQMLFSAVDSPLNSLNIILKDVFDRIVALVLLILLAVPFGLIALLIKLTSRGPVFYKQNRVGSDQREFKIFKFRTMKADAQKGKDQPQWTMSNDPRRTWIGKWLRRTSIDELPQLINVLIGEMSLVGPRPEQPHFVKQFSEEYRKYMLRHKVKAGMTGWAQIHGFRGDTSLKKRLQYDLYYIRNWSFGLDLWILLMTPWYILKGKNAY